MSEIIASYVSGTKAYPNHVRVESLNANNYGVTRMAPEGGKYFQAAREGQVFSARGAAASIPVSAASGTCPTLWNPSDSGKILAILKINLSLAAKGTPAIWGLSLAQTLLAGNSVGAALPIKTFTDIPPVSTRIGGPAVVSNAKFANATVTFLAAPTVIMDLGAGGWIDGTAANSGPVSNLSFDLDGAILLMPGTALSVVGTVASSTTFITNIVFAELPEIVL